MSDLWGHWHRQEPSWPSKAGGMSWGSTLRHPAPPSPLRETRCVPLPPRSGLMPSKWAQPGSWAAEPPGLSVRGHAACRQRAGPVQRRQRCDSDASHLSRSSPN